MTVYWSETTPLRQTSGFKRSVSLLLIISTVVAVVHCSESPTETNKPVTRVKMADENLRMATGTSLALNFIISVDDSVLTELRSVSWSIEDTSVIVVNSDGIITALKEGKSTARIKYESAYDEVSVSVYDFLGRVVLENQEEHSGIMISWWQDETAGGRLATDSLGYYVLPVLSDGEWIIKAEFPYYEWKSDTIQVSNGKPERPITALILPQQLSFEMILDKTEYGYEEEITYSFKATNISSETIEVVSSAYPVYSCSYAIRKDNQVLFTDDNEGNRWYRIITPCGAASFHGRTLLAGETIIEPIEGSLPSQDNIIELWYLYLKGAIEVEEEYQLYAGYPADVTYPLEYFTMSSEDSIKQFSHSIYGKLEPVTITITEPAAGCLDTTNAVSFPDENFWAVIKRITDKWICTITYDELLDITVIYSSYPEVEDITGIEYLVNLERIHLSFGTISDITPITNLVKLQEIELHYNNISNISPLANLTDVSKLYLQVNQINDISALQKLVNLETVNLRDNLIEDIKPLVDNPGLGEGDSIRLDGNPLSDTSINEYIPILQSRGVTVQW